MKRSRVSVDKLERDNFIYIFTIRVKPTRVQESTLLVHINYNNIDKCTPRIQADHDLSSI